MGTTMFFHRSLKSASTLNDVAALLGFKASALAYIIYKKDPARKYRDFEIPKKYGGTRKISAPSDELKLMQRRLSDLLRSHIEETNSREKPKNKISHGFEPDRSIVTNAACHRNRRYVFNTDIQDFFGTINFGRVRGLFLKDNNFELNETVATILAQIACHENALPQGSPCSPVISNLIGHIIDVHLVKLAARHGCRYTRYADDLTFSTNLKIFPAPIARIEDGEPHEWRPGKKLIRVVKHCGFELNPRKTRMQYRDSRQEVTGLVVNRKVNVRSEYRRKVRAMVHRLFTAGHFDFEQTVVEDNGNIAMTKTPGTLSQLHGMLGFIHGIDDYNRVRVQQSPHQEVTHAKQPQSKEVIYRRFLLFKEFYAAPTPVIICEGKTDNVYLLHAIHGLASNFPTLASIEENGKINVLIRIFKYSDTGTGKILGLTGGAPCLNKFIESYRSETGKFTAPGRLHPVILLVDNDKGAHGIYSKLNRIVEPAPDRSDPFVHVFGNLYVVPTPLTPQGDSSMIEDFFSDELKATRIGEKTFSPDDDADRSQHYGKVVFAHKVVRPNADSIDFSRFMEMLANICAVIDVHTKRFPTSEGS